MDFTFAIIFMALIFLFYYLQQLRLAVAVDDLALYEARELAILEIELVRVHVVDA